MNPITKNFWPPNAFRYGGGGSTAANAVKQAPAPAVAPPVTATNSEVIQAQNDMRRQSLRKRGFSKTVFAGDTGGWHPTSNTPSPTNPVAGAGAAGRNTRLGA